MLSRRAFLGATGGLALGVGAAACTSRQGSTARGAPAAQQDGFVQHFFSRPDLRPAEIIVTANSGQTAPGLFFVDSHGGVGQQGPMIIDGNGQLVWFKPLSDNATPDMRAFTVRTQQYRGEPVLVWFEGAVVSAHGEGEFVLADTSYNEIARVRAGNGHIADLHEFIVTEQDTALFICYGTQQGDEPYFYGLVQEVDIATGEVVFQWRSDEHIPVSDSYKAKPPPPGEPYDYFHLNSIAVDTDGNLIISARNTWALYKIDRPSGEVLWTIGGKNSDFRVDENARFAWQHDAIPRGDGILTLFDNQATPAQAKESRGLVLRVDERAKTVGLVDEYTHPGRPILAGALGSMGLLPGDRVLVGFCQPAVWTEYTRDGNVLFDARLAGPQTKTYRVYKSEWTGQPDDEPAISVRTEGSRTVVDVSWNGATEVALWRVVGGATEANLTEVIMAGKQGFETTIDVPGTPARIAVEALGAHGKVLGRSAVRGTS